jgi:hypothetical protein
MRLRTCTRFVIAVLVLLAAACEPPTVPPRRVASRAPDLLPPSAADSLGWSGTIARPTPTPAPTPQPQSPGPTTLDEPAIPADSNALDRQQGGAAADLIDDKMDLPPVEQGIGGATTVAASGHEHWREQRTKGPRRESAPASPSAPMPVVAELARALEEGEAERLASDAPAPVEQILRQEKARFQRCYDALVLRDPATLPGSLSVRLVLGPAGDIQQAEVVSGTLQDPDFRDCIMTKLTALSFPRNDAMLDFTYPFRFGEPGGEGSVE